jgi:ribosome biogenesis GTPase
MSPPLTLEELGWSEALARAMPDEPGLSPARVASVYSARVEVWTPEGPRLAALRARVLRDEPAVGGIAVGDWVAVAASRIDGAAEDEVVVEHVLPRRTAFLRQAAGERAEPQAIAANVDRVFIVTSVEGDFNARRIERYLVAIRAGGAEPFIVLTKADLVSDVGGIVAEASSLAPVIVTSAVDGLGLDALVSAIPRGTTAALAGSSGVGKSALVNRLLGSDVQTVGAVREHDKRGRHTTTRRALFALPHGGLLVDTPGMRELKPWRAESPEAGDEDTFADIVEIAASCKYRNCRHEAEPGCAVHAAVEAGTLDASRVASFEKLRNEREAHATRQEQFQALQDKRRRARTATIALRKRVRERR